MEYGAHLPLIEFDGARRTVAELRAYARQAAARDYRFLCANDHLLFGRPWLDGPTALAAVIEESADMRLATTVALANGIATMWLYVTESGPEADRMLGEVLAPMLGRPIEELRDLALPIGPAEQCAERISAYAEAGAERVFVWPLADELRQLELFREAVVPLVSAGS